MQVAGVWTLISGWNAMNSLADRYYTAVVPAAQLTFARKLVSGSDITSGVTIDPSALINSTPAALVVQDGVSIPQIIYYDSATGTLAARRLKLYNQWTLLNREYVPIGKQMVYFNGILFIVSADGLSLYRSVSGRPLDFVVNIDTNGNKGGDAITTAYPLGFSPVTALIEQNTAYIFYSTENDESYALALDFNNTIFGEPTFTRTFIFDSGAVGQDAGVDILGDFAFISHQGLRSYNAVFQQRYEGRNSVFSAILADLLRDQVQTANACSIVWDNYAFFSLKTVYGYGLFVYDTLTKKFISLDFITAATTQLKQLVANGGTQSAPQLWAIGTDNSVWRLYYGGATGIDYAQASVVIRSVSAVIPGIALKATNVRIVFKTTPGTTEGTARLYSFVDGKQDSSVVATKVLTAAPVATVTLDGVPIPLDNAKNVFDWIVTTPNAQQGHNTQFVVSFPGNAILSALSSDFNDVATQGVVLNSR